MKRVTFQAVLTAVAVMSSYSAIASIDENAPTLESVLPRAYSEQEINSCIQSVCGPAKSNYSNSDAMTPRKNESLNFTKAWTDLLEPKIKEKFSIEALNDAVVAKQVRKAVATGFLFRTKDKSMLKAVFGLRLTFEKVKSSINQILQASSGERVINEKALYAFLAKQPANEREALKLGFKLTFAVTQASSPLIHPDDSVFDKRMKRLYPTLEGAAAIATDTKLLLGIYDRIGRKLGLNWQGMAVPLDGLAAIKEAHASGAVNESDDQKYTESALLLQYYSMAFRKANFDIFVEAGSDSSPLIRAAAESNAYTEMIKQTKAVEQSASTLKVCRPRLAMNLAMNASDLEIRQMKKMADVVKAGAKIVASRQSSDDLSVTSAIDRIQFVYPESSKDKWDHFMTEVDSELAQQKAIQNFAIESPEDFSDFVLMNLVVAAVRPNLASDLSADPKPDAKAHAKAAAKLRVRKSQIQSICESLRQDIVSDQFLDAKGLISVSWFAVNYSEVGLPFMAHELGHVVSAELSKISQTRAIPYVSSYVCSENRSPFVSQAEHLTDVNFSTPQAEEDYADHFSNLVMNELTAQGSPWMQYSKNFACALVNDTGGAYAQNEFKPDADDRHSPALLRLLMSAVDRGQMTPQCAPLVEYAKSADRELKCQ